ncbi:glycosyltransferase family 4 protein [Microbulbifer sp. CAU 1566]|uniref:glycosyltransferase family 4 protein n=1 Tax=Microbulbifer sp. CAU 1566 TaxID=2933269 RepID=UPI0020040301|nr:glycosyltransferase family 4 protein [Microbulbifer sp. CAU 1566]MCK7598404.1 glycosyltransferase family 4 protein [Microbulbifer sp. CAU 1566]
MTEWLPITLLVFCVCWDWISTIVDGFWCWTVFQKEFFVKILLIHNAYKIFGGEDSVLAEEEKLITNGGYRVAKWEVSNHEVSSIWDKVKAFLFTPFSFYYFFKCLKVLKNEMPDVVHVHNYFPLLSPSIFYACKVFGVPVVHTLHNYRAVCPSALLMHAGKINENSINHGVWWSIRKKVYRKSYVGTFALAMMVALHKSIRTWNLKVDRFIALTEFSRKKFIEAGWPESKICIKPNFISDPITRDSASYPKGGYALFVGRLSAEKGVNTLLNAWLEIKFPLKIIGAGPLVTDVEQRAGDCVEYLGEKNKEEVISLMRGADFIIMPSIWYEGFPMVLVEALACGTPALVSRLGSMEEIVCNGIVGLHFEPGNSVDLANKVQWLLDNPEAAHAMGENARNEYLEKYTPERNIDILMSIYGQAIEAAAVRGKS